MLSSGSKRSNILKSGYMKTLILVVVLVGSVIAFWFGLRVALGTEYPFLTVASGSMRPTLNVGDLIVVQGVWNAGDLKAAPRPEGDIIVFRSPRVEGEMIVHRAVDKVQHNGLWFFETEGDQNGTPDIWTGSAVPPEDLWGGKISERLLIGKVIGRVPWLGYVPLYVRTPVGFLFIVILVIIIIFAEYIPIPFKRKPSQS